VGNAIPPQQVWAKPGRQTHFGAIHSYKIGKSVKVLRMHKAPMQNFLYLFSGMQILSMM